MRVEFYTAADGWRWRVVHLNGNVLGDGGQGYSRRVDAVAGFWALVDGVTRPGTEFTFNGEPGESGR